MKNNAGEEGELSWHRQAGGSPWSRKVKIANQLCPLMKSPSHHNLSLWESLTKNFPNQWRQILLSSLSNHTRTWVPKPIILGETETWKLRTSPYPFMTPPTCKFPVPRCLQPPPGLSRSYPVQRTTRERLAGCHSNTPSNLETHWTWIPGVGLVR